MITTSMINQTQISSRWSHRTFAWIYEGSVFFGTELCVFVRLQNNLDYFSRQNLQLYWQYRFYFISSSIKLYSKTQKIRVNFQNIWKSLVIINSVAKRQKYIPFISRIHFMLLGNIFAWCYAKLFEYPYVEHVFYI